MLAGPGGLRICVLTALQFWAGSSGCLPLSPAWRSKRWWLSEM